MALDVNAARTAVGSAVTLKDFVAEWLPIVRAEIRPTTFALYEAQFMRYWLPRIGDLTLPAITGPIVHRTLDQLRAAGLCTGSLRVALNALRRALEKAVEWGELHGNPARAVRLGPHRSPREAIPVEAIERLIAAVENIRVRQIAVVMFQTGLRVGECVALRWEHIDLETRIAHVIQTWREEHGVGPTKSGRSRLIHLTALALAHLPPPQPEGWVWPNRYGKAPISGHYIEKQFRLARRRAQLPEHVTPHTMRHSCGTALIEHDVPERYVQQMFGHSNSMMTRHYTRTAKIGRPANLDEALAMGRRGVHQAANPARSRETGVR